MKHSNTEIIWYEDKKHWYLYAVKKYETGRLMLKIYERSDVGNHEYCYKDIGNGWRRVNQSEIIPVLSDCSIVRTAERVLVPR